MELIKFKTKDKRILKNPNYIISFKYRDIVGHIEDDDNGQQYYCQDILGKEYGFGAFNNNWEDEVKAIIDNELDTIYLFEKPLYALLQYDRNNRDEAMLIYHGKEIKRFDVLNTSLDKVIKNAYNHLTKHKDKIEKLR